MQMLFNNHIQIANKWLVLLSGLDKNAINMNGKKVYEKHYFHLPKEWTNINWSMTKIKQILAYAGLANSQGDLGVVDLEELSSILRCSVRSLLNNQKTFIKLGLVEVEKLYGDLVHIKLQNYLSNFLDLYPNKSYSEDEEEYSSRTGYTRIKKEVLFDLFEIKKVNVLRVACRALYLHEKEVNIGGNNSVLLTSHTLKGILPTYFSYRPVIKRAIRQLTRLFEMKFFNVQEDKEQLLSKYKATPSILDKLKSPYLLSMKLHPKKDSRKVLEEEQGSLLFYPPINHFYNLTRISSENNHNSIQELAYEYGTASVKQAIEEIVACYQNRFDDVSDTAVEVFSDIKKLERNDEPIGVLRNIFKKFALSLQEGYLFQF